LIYNLFYAFEVGLQVYDLSLLLSVLDLAPGSLDLGLVGWVGGLLGLLMPTSKALLLKETCKLSLRYAESASMAILGGFLSQPELLGDEAWFSSGRDSQGHLQNIMSHGL
jgi:hypothetical protein